MQAFFKERRKNHWSNQGMTVIEVLIVIVLMAVVLAPAVNALSTTTKIWSHNSAINPCIARTNASMSWIIREIRSAAQPSSTVDSVLVEDGGQRLIIYRYNDIDSKWEKVFYQINGDNQLKKIILSESDPKDIIDAGIPNPNDSGWTTLLEGVTSNPAFNRSSNSRTVEVNLQVSDSGQTNERFAPFNLASTYMVRSREVGAITGAGVPDETTPPVVPVHKVDINLFGNKIIDLNDENNKSHDISATIWPANATNKSATWSSSDPNWVTVTSYDPNSLTANVKVVGKFPWYTPYLWFQDFNITVTSEGKSDKCIIRVWNN